MSAQRRLQEAKWRPGQVAVEGTVPCPFHSGSVCDGCFDLLTGLPNRAHFLRRLARAVEQARSEPSYRFAMLFLDLDGFKRVNDTLGHAVGDEALIEVARRLLECTRPGDVVARLGGDEFAILVEGRNPEVIALAERIRERLDHPLRLRGHQAFVTASVGITTSAWGYEGAEGALRDADAAMYRAKAGGRSRAEIVDSDLRRKHEARRRLEDDLRRDCERPDVAFEVQYQPIIRLRERRVAGFEALVRWHHPRLGVLAPATFMPAAERTGLVAPIGWWTLDVACRQLGEWHRRQRGGCQPFLDVNLSAYQLSQPDALKRLAGSLRAAGLGQRWLRLDVSELALACQLGAMRVNLRGLGRMDVGLHLDGFGAGPGSLVLLSGVPVTGVKVDCSWLLRRYRRRRGVEVIKSLVRLAQALEIEPIAEGVEGRDLAAHLEACQCLHAQGFFFSAPLDATRAGELIARRPTD